MWRMVIICMPQRQEGAKGQYYFFSCQPGKLDWGQAAEWPVPNVGRKRIRNLEIIGNCDRWLTSSYGGMDDVVQKRHDIVTNL